MSSIRAPQRVASQGADPVESASKVTPGYRAPAVSRALQVLSLLERDGDGLGVSDIARHLQIGKGPCFAILKALEAGEMVVCDRKRKAYRLGAALVRLGTAAAGRQKYVEVARRAMERVAAEIGLACFLSAPYGSDEFVVVAKAESPEKVKITLDLGEHFHALGGAHGKALLAWQGREAVDRAIRELGLPRYTSSSITVPDQLRQALERTRRLGYAESYGEYMLGVNSVAAPIFNDRGEVLLILKTIGAESQLPPRKMREFGRRIRRGAEDVTAALGGQYPGPGR
jgi:DNA-binding IclR family transcriptional regulator